MIAFSGVRSSWVMFARNCDLCWLATSSCAARLLELLEQPGVLDRDDRLVGERLEQRDRPSAGTRRASCGGSTSAPSDALLAQQRHGEQRRGSRRAQRIGDSDRAANAPSAATSAIWTGARRSAARPTTPSPQSERACSSAAISSSDIRWRARSDEASVASSYS